MPSLGRKSIVLPLVNIWLFALDDQRIRREGCSQKLISPKPIKSSVFARFSHNAAMLECCGKGATKRLANQNHDNSNKMRMIHAWSGPRSYLLP